MSLPPRILANYMVAYDTTDLPEDVDISTAVDMIRTDLQDRFPATEYDHWFLSQTDGKPITIPTDVPEI